MKYFLPSLRDLVLMVSLCAMILASAAGLRQGLSADVLQEQLQNIYKLTPHLSLGLLFICIQLAAMRWGGVLLNAGLTFTSILLFCLMTTLALGPEIAMTGTLHDCANTAGMGHPLQANPALYWLIPVAWFLCLLGAKSQVRTFCLTMVCYAIWLIFTPMLNKGLMNWAEQEEPPMPAITEILTGADWMPAATFGIFLLIFCLLVGFMDSAFPETPDKKDK